MLQPNPALAYVGTRRVLCRTLSYSLPKDTVGPRYRDFRKTVVFHSSIQVFKRIDRTVSVGSLSTGCKVPKVRYLIPPPRRITTAEKIIRGLSSSHGRNKDENLVSKGKVTYSRRYGSVMDIMKRDVSSSTVLYSTSVFPFLENRKITELIST